LRDAEQFRGFAKSLELVVKKAGAKGCIIMEKIKGRLCRRGNWQGGEYVENSWSYYESQRKV